MKPRLLVAAVAVVGVSGCGSTTPPSPPTPASSVESNPSSSEPRQPTDAASAPKDVEHVHNLALTDGETLLLGTHEGLWQQEAAGSPLVRLSEPFDVMGLSVRGDSWLASGHPAPGAHGPPDLGLVRSTDGGTTWDAVALRGRADFHRLVQSNDTVLGVNSGDGMLWRSSDQGETWRELGPAPFDIAIDPAYPDRVIGTTAQGMVVSNDGGRSWKGLSPEPRLALLSWTRSQVYGVSPEGRIYRSSNAGKRWEQVGEVRGQPRALAADGPRVAVLSAGKIWVSEDGGRTFQARVTGIPLR